VGFAPDDRSEHTVIVCDTLPVREQRVIIFYLLYIMDVSGYELSSELAIDSFTQGYFCTIDTQGFIAQRVHAVVAAREELDNAMRPLLQNWRLERLSVSTRLITRMALWELEHTDLDVAIVINEALELAKTFAEQDAYKFVNGVLDEWAKRHPKADRTSIETQ
jgi:N utilization substance protein B